MLNKQKGNMYSFVTDTWNTVKGKCPHGCHYCYMKRWGEQPELHFDESELKTDLGSENFIFVGSSCDMFADGILHSWIMETVNHCVNAEHRNNTFLFQSKNPKRFLTWAFPDKVVLGTTIETNRIYPEMGETPSPHDRAHYMSRLQRLGMRTMVTVEPIMDFDIGVLLTLILACNPAWVNIGANTNSKVPLTEPPKEKILELIEALKEFTDVKIKPNLKRLIRWHGGDMGLSDFMPDGYYVCEKRLWVGNISVDIGHIDNDLSKPLDHETAFKKMLEKLKEAP